VIIYHHRSLRMVRPRTQSAVEMCVAYLILESIAALATTGRRAPQYWRVSGKILDRGRGASRLAWCARGIGLRFRLGFRSENFPISSMFYPTERPGDCMGMAAIMPSLFDVYQFKESEIY
jgi:hypothetical protein